MRYLPLDADDRRLMLQRIGAADIEALFADIPGEPAASRSVADAAAP